MFPVYKDMSFCARKDCANTDCIRHFSQIDFDSMPDWMCYSLAEFNNCTKYQKEDETDDSQGTH